MIARAAAAVRAAAARARPVTHLGVSQAEVEKVASNRRILGPDGKVKHVRYTACKDPEVRDMPVGTIDPVLKMISFWDGDAPVVALTYYATHPQSYYRTGLANPDFPGIARDRRQEETGVPHVHFDGAGGNIGAGKWNDGSPENRQVLADRVADGDGPGVGGDREDADHAPPTSAGSRSPVALPPAPHLDEARLLATPRRPRRRRSPSGPRRPTTWPGSAAARRATRSTSPASGSGKARVLHLPGELFVEYQLAAQACGPTCSSPWPPTATTPRATSAPRSPTPRAATRPARGSLVAPGVERVLTDAINRLLRD